MLKIYGAPVSVHTRKAIIAANLKQLPHEVIPVIPARADTFPADWSTLSPSRLIPAMADGDFAITDSTAICLYLEQVYPEHAIYPTAARARARALSWEGYASDRLFRGVVRVLFIEVVLAPRIQQRPTDSALVSQTLSGALPEVFKTLDEALHGPYLAGDSLSMADVAVASNLINYHYCGFEIDRSKYRRLAGLFERMVHHPAVRDALAAERQFADWLQLNGDILKRSAA
jgi:glutathione S-transferase